MWRQDVVEASSREVEGFFADQESRDVDLRGHATTLQASSISARSENKYGTIAT